MTGTEDTRVSRRKLFGMAGAGAALVGTGAAAGFGANRLLGGDSPAQAAQSVVEFHGEHQAGIVTPVQENLHFVALDVTTKDREKLVKLLRTWTDAARRMTAGREVGTGGAVGGAPAAPPSDTGEALDLAASSLTLTIGFGPSLFDDRFGLAPKRPAALIDLPLFPADKLDPARSGGDVCIQACADDPQVAVHAIRNLVRLGFGVTAVRWSQLGFGRSSSTSRAQSTPRNLFGFKDGTRNVKAEEADVLRDQVWATAEDGQPWMAGGSFLVARRIRMHIETWDRESLRGQEGIVGRSKGAGAPLGQAAEFDEPDFNVGGAGGEKLIPEDSHVRLASHENLNGARILRRGYNFVDGSDGVGHLDAGLFFLAFNRDTRKQFVPMQQALSSKDAMMEYLQHTGSAHFAVPPGVREGGFWGEGLFA
ncbi:iron uptake transporter deferrochelatase/peroxidase subunit [Amycolatopsis sp. BJA-103]|uniref:iron uptake transporter deferrochelatase/peroxidase subunit n=1 Tax=Amycolatopsis sp. BJA-103 TaxID=1911175 RepID=UPI000C755FE5|nr:iron uptake transporter deferrochelatase/peroxidase subunit [Amycolatopsis sp. BJA-103]AUI61675.1 peroxidase [Amycolatopsis sp. BJA-103]PNE21031.1 peroxidase [Amycolatopsis sp. BJA-103]